MKNAYLKRILPILFMLLLYTPPGALAGELVLASGSPLGTYFTVAHDIKTVLRKAGIPVRVKATQGAMNNINLLNRGEAGLAITQQDIITEYGGEGIHPLLTLFKEEIHIFSMGKVKTFDDLKGALVSCGPKESGTCVTTRVLNRTFGLNLRFKELGVKELIPALKSGEIAAGVFVGGKPVRFLEEADGLNLIEIPRNEDLGKLYRRAVIKGADYSWLSKKVFTYATPSVLVMGRTGVEKEGLLAGRIVLALLSGEKMLKNGGHAKWGEVLFTGARMKEAPLLVQKILESCSLFLSLGYTCNEARMLVDF